MSGKSKSDNKIKDTPEQRYAAQVAAEKWNFAQQELAPLQQRYMDRVDNMDSESRKSYIRGATNQSAAASQSQVSDQAGQALSSANINPNSGRWGSTMTDVAVESGAAGGETQGRALFENTASQVGGMQNVVAIGSGQESQAQAGLSTIASASAADARGKATNAYNRRSANLQLLGTVAGAGTSYAMNNGGLKSLIPQRGGALDNSLGAAYSKATGSFDTDYGTAAPLSWQLENR